MGQGTAFGVPRGGGADGGSNTGSRRTLRCTGSNHTGRRAFRYCGGVLPSVFQPPIAERNKPMTTEAVFFRTMRASERQAQHELYRRRIRRRKKAIAAGIGFLLGAGAAAAAIVILALV